MGYTIVLHVCIFIHILLLFYYYYVYTSDEYILYYILYSVNEQYNDCV